MIKVTIELISAITGRTSEIGRMYLANDGDKSNATRGRLGDYVAGVCRRGSTAVPAPVDPDGPRPTRSGSVSNYPRNSYNVWRLIARALFSAFPEERALAVEAGAGDYAHDPASEADDEQALELGRELVHVVVPASIIGEESVLDLGRRAWRRGARPNAMPEVA
jgi:hypothetical protein